jgi:hypothetical protein
MDYACRLLPILLCSLVGCTLFTRKSNESPDAGVEGGARTADGDGTEGGEGGSGALPASTQAYLNELSVYSHGGTLPAAGNRGAVTSTANSDGSHTISIAGAKGTERLHVEWQGFGSYTATADVNADGTVDEQFTTTTSGSVPTTVWELDKNTSGAFNWRATMTTSPSLSVSAMVEQIPLGMTTFTETSAYASTVATAGPACANADPKAIETNGSCDALAMYPSTPTFCQFPTPPTPTPPKECFWSGGVGDQWRHTEVHPVTALGAGPYYIITDGPMKCTFEQSQAIVAALRVAGPDFDNAVVNTLNDTWALVDVAVSLTSGIYYGCAPPPCAGAVAAATAGAYFSDVQNVFITAIDPGIVALGADVLEEIIIHEWYHVILQHVPDAKGGSERDFIYACSRVANGGKAWNAGKYLGDCCDASSARDHAMCADETLKLQFGVQHIFQEAANGFIETPNPGFTGYMDMNPPPTCSDTATPPNKADCLCYLEQVPAYCDQTTLTQDDALKLGLVNAAETISSVDCCESCPVATPIAGLGLCGTHTTTTTCLPPPEVCTTLPDGEYAIGPTPLWRNPPASPLAGQAPTSEVMDGGCQPVAGFPY